MIYADNAATSWPKPPLVTREMIRSIELYGANPGRSSHKMSREAESMVYNCRKAVAALFNAQPENIIFTQNATHALNIAILGSVFSGGHIVISDIEHNSVYRPVLASGCSYSVLKTNAENDDITLSNLRKILRPDTAMIAVTAAGNLTGQRLPVSKIGEIAKERGILFIVDASQAAGHFGIDVKRDNIDILCAPGHKGLLGPQGSGIMVLTDKMPQPIMFGGSGSMSVLPNMPENPPERFEAGTLNTPAIAGLYRGVEYIKSVGIENIEKHENCLACQIYEGLSKLPKIKLIGDYPQSGLVAFNIEGQSSEAVALTLSECGVMVRGGLHCSPLAHRKFDTSDMGAVRISLGCFNTEAQVKKILQIIKNLI